MSEKDFMTNEKYQIRYLPLFLKDLEEAVDYIANILSSPEAAERLIKEVESAILKRSENPLAFEQYPSKKDRKYPYYRIYVKKNYVVFYVVDGDVMEVRRFLYQARKLPAYL